MTKRALQLSLAKQQKEMFSLKRKMIRENASKTVLEIIDARILSIKKTRYELSVYKYKDTCSKTNVDFGSYFWNKDSEFIKLCF